MIHYKGFLIWYNDLQSGWIIQTGYNISSKAYKSLGAAKGAITKDRILWRGLSNEN